RNTEIVGIKASSLMIKPKRLSEELSNKRSTSTEELYKKFRDLTLYDQYTLLSDLLQFFAQSAYIDQIQILTLCPESWGRLKVAKFLDATDTQARNAIELRVTKGILARPEYCRGNQLIEVDTVNQVIDYYSLDSVSRASPNKRDTLLIRFGDAKDKIRVAVRFLTCTVGDAYEKFRQDYPGFEIRRSKFHSLRPKYVKKTSHLACVSRSCKKCDDILGSRVARTGDSWGTEQRNCHGDPFFRPP
ncbi:unnamed protein product, partial [Didymodactylos carnosus]